MTIPSSSDILRGTLDLLILRTLALEPMHGWAISERIQQLSRGALQVGQGSLYPALQRMENRAWVSSEWKLNSEGRRARFYTLTGRGPAGARCRVGELEELCWCGGTCSSEPTDPERWQWPGIAAGCEDCGSW